MKMNKVGIMLTSSVLSFGLFSSIADASSITNGQPEKAKIQVAATDAVITKDELIKKFRKMFPNQFDYLTNNDFQVSSAHIYPEDETVRHDLYFSKTINGKRVYGNVGFIGNELEIEYFSYQPPTITDALFPAKVSKEEAKKIAENFIKKFLDGKDYQLETDALQYYPQQILTEPIRYSFIYTRTQNEVPIADQRVEVSVLGNGEVVNFYKISPQLKSVTFSDVTKIIDKEVILKKVKENLAVDLNYQINYNYPTGDRSVELIYRPTAKLTGIEAISEKWMTTNGYAEELSKNTKIDPIAANPFPVKQGSITVEDAKKIAERFLAIDSDKLKLKIESIQEIENYNGQAVINVHYTYNYANGSSGSSIEINKNTGEIIQYYDMKDYILRDIGEAPKKDKMIPEQEALTKAVNYLKEWTPSYLHNYAMPIEEPYYDERVGTYQFIFPRIMNGIIVAGDQISVGINVDGSLNSLYVNYQEIDNWPSSEEVISEQKAKAILEEALDVKLSYMNHVRAEQENHYDLIYTPVFNDDPFSYINATTGEWNNMFSNKDSITVTHPWAEEELNYLINAKVMEVKDVKNFTGDSAITKGEALKVILNSLTYFYHGNSYYGQESTNQTFENIDPQHPLYDEIERAVGMGIIKADRPTFDADAPITREELSVWMIRVLGLERAAKDNSIYKLGFSDADQIQTENTGYVAMASSMGLIKAEQNHFSPTREVTYAELAVSTIRLAHAIAESGRGLQYY